jgi:hypothetical protein
VTTRETLLAAADLVDRGWCRKYAALNRYGVECDPDSDSAVCWCAFGACVCAAGSDDRAEPALDALREHVGRSIPEWNDRLAPNAAAVSAALRAAAGGAA